MNDISEVKEKAFKRAGGKCEICKKNITISQSQLAHIIPQRNYNIALYSYNAIHNIDNLVITCSLECNSIAGSAGNSDIALDHITDIIAEKTTTAESRQNIIDYCIERAKSRGTL